MVKLFLEDVKTGAWNSRGWPEYWTDYAVSKLALNAYSKVLAKRYEGRGISVNCFCPGHTQTSMTQGTGNYTADAAAEIGINLTLLPAEALPTGKFFLRSSRGVFSNAYSKLQNLVIAWLGRVCDLDTPQGFCYFFQLIVLIFFFYEFFFLMRFYFS